MKPPATLALIATVCLSAAAGAQGPLRLGVAGGASFPTGNATSFAQTGFTVQGMAELPLGLLLDRKVSVDSSLVALRGEVAYHEMETNGQLPGGRWRLFGAQAAVSLAFPFLPGRVVPYGAAGVGAFRTRPDYPGAPGAETKLALHVGAGLRFRLGAVEPVLEARWQSVQRSTAMPSTLTFVPVTFGLLF